MSSSVKRKEKYNPITYISIIGLYERILNNNDLLANLDKIHTTDLGVERIRKNLSLDTDDVVAWCKSKIINSDTIKRKGKNWYVQCDDFTLTVNANSFTIITAHRDKKHLNLSN